MMYVAVRHNLLEEKCYWFYVPGILMERVRIGRKVVCQTKYGRKEGTVSAIISGVPEKTMRELTGNTEGLKPVVGVYGVIALSEISVPMAFATSIPSGAKLSKRIEEFQRHGNFDTLVAVDQLNELRDGYSAYLIAKAYGLETIKVLFVV